MAIVVANVLAVSSVAAADLTTVETSTSLALPVADGPAFDWSGFYTGVFAGLATDPAGSQFGGGINAGVNAQVDFYLLGAEVAVRGLTGDAGETVYGQILGRAGLVVADDAVVYAAGGYGIDLGKPDEQDVLLGGGLEFAVNETFSVRAEYLHSFPVQGTAPGGQVTLGANFHF
jgi:outer membrane immunogenic protein